MTRKTHRRLFLTDSVKAAAGQRILPSAGTERRGRAMTLATLHWLGVALCLVMLPATAVAQQPPVRTRATLPQEHPDQVVIREYLASLTEEHFTHGVREPFRPADADADAEVNYRHYMLTLMLQPLVGTKRGAPAINAPPKLFLLSALEHPDGVRIPPVWPEAVMSLVNWKYPGNPYYQNRALQHRAFVRCAIQLLMAEDYLSHSLDPELARRTWLGSHLILIAFPYPGFRDILPENVQTAYRAGLRRIADRALARGPSSEEPNLESVCVVGLWHASQALGDADFSRECAAYARRWFTDPRYFHPAGFFRDHQGIDIGYQGMTNFHNVWTALASDWPFAREALNQSYRLRGHLLLPEPDGKWVGPSHFNSRTSSDAAADQWEWGLARDAGASLATTEAIHLTRLPDDNMLARAGAIRASAFNGQIAENPVSPQGGFLKNDELANTPWTWRLWQSFHFPAGVNPGYEFYPPGAYGRHRKLVDEQSPLLRSPYLRGENFVRHFSGAFTAIRQPGYGAILSSGPVGFDAGELEKPQFQGSLGYGGGQLSAYWTPATGSVILGRRGGSTRDRNLDPVENWRNWPFHAVSGALRNGKVFTSARIAQPEVRTTGEERLDVRGVVPRSQLGQGPVLTGEHRYSRAFRYSAESIEVETVLQSAGEDLVAELYETIPVFLHDARQQPDAAPTTIQFRVQDQWQPATTDPARDVTAVKLGRFEGHVVITFDRPRTVKLSPEVWADNYLSAARCRTLLIDLLDGDATLEPLTGERKVAYRIQPE